MSEIVDATGRAIRSPKRRGKDLARLDEVVNIVGNMTGPIAIVVQEMMQKIARLEDKVGITDETEAAEPAPPKGTPYASMTPRAAEPVEAPRVSEPTLPGGDVE